MSKDAVLNSIETTFKYGVYYRVDVDAQLSVSNSMNGFD